MPPLASSVPSRLWPPVCLLQRPVVPSVVVLLVRMAELLPYPCTHLHMACIPKRPRGLGFWYVAGPPRGESLALPELGAAVLASSMLLPQGKLTILAAFVRVMVGTTSRATCGKLSPESIAHVGCSAVRHAQR